MATIGLYDIDLHHGASFSISLPLMQSYARLKSEGHQVIMMKPYEKTGRYNKIFYFKDNPRLVIPKKLILDQDKGKCLGFGFYGTAGISPETAEFAPSFEPYDLFSDKVRDKTLYKSIKANSLIDWREKDFAGAKAGKGTTYVNDRNFLMEEDWEDLFNHYDNNIDFIHSIRAESYDDQAFIKLAQKPYGPKTRLIAHSGLNKETFERFKNCRGIVYDYTDAMDLFMQTFISKVIDIPISFEFKYLDSSDFFLTHLLRWNNLYGRISFKEYMIQMNMWDPGKFMNFPYRLLLQQDPTKITYNELVEEYLVK